VNKKAFCLLLLLVVSISLGVVYAREPTEETWVYDGWIVDLDPPYTRYTTLTDYLDIDSDRTAFLEYNITNIPDTALIDNVSITFKQHTGVAGGINFYAMNKRPSTTADNDAGNEGLYDDAKNGTLYATAPDPAVVNTTYTVYLVEQACTDLQGLLASDYFAVGISDGSPNRIWGTHGGYNTTLTVSWHLATDYVYNFTDTYYENGTRYHPPVEVTATDSFAETFNTSGGSTEYYPIEPSHFYWSLTAGISRVIHSVGSENITVTIPESTFGVYEFTIKDYLGAIGSGDAYLEAYRIINGTDTLIERMKITQPNPVPLNLVVGRTYHLKILLPDGSRYDWGYFVATSSTEHSILLREPTWSDEVQVLYNTITVDAARAGNTITVNYEDNRTNTVWANVTIRVRNGAIVAQNTRANDTYTINHAPINETLSYVVTVTGEHSDFGEWGRSFILDSVPTFPDAPDLSIVFGGSSDLLPFLISLTAMLAFFGKRFYVGGLMAGMFLASFFTYFGWASWGYNYLVFGWFIALGASVSIMQSQGGN
jgi:hypothetical protein